MSVRFVLYLILVGIAYAIYSFSANEPLLFLLILLLALPICSFVLLFIGRHFVRISLTSAKAQVFRLEPFTLMLAIENRSPFFFPLVKIEFNLPHGNDSLLPDQDWHTSFSDQSSGEVHFFDEYVAYDGNDAESLPDAGVEGTAGAAGGGEGRRPRGVDRRRTWRLYPTPHFAYVRKILTAVLPQRSTSYQEITLSARNKGSYQVGTDSILLQDLFGFFYLPLPRSARVDRASGKSRTSVEMDVIPNPYRWQSPNAGKLQAPEEVLMNTQNLKVSNEVDTLANVRDFVPGDRIKQIHWKLSARSGKWLAREFEDPRQGGILFVMDPKLPDDCIKPLNYSNDAPEIMASTMKQLSRTEGPLSLLLGEDYYTAPGEGIEPQGFYRAMMHWKPQIRENDPRSKESETRQACQITSHRLELSDLLRKETAKQRYRAIVILTARMSEQLSDEIRRAQKQGSQVLLIFLHNETKQTLNEMLRPLAAAKIRLFPTRLNSLVPYQEAVAGSANAAQTTTAGQPTRSARSARGAKTAKAPRAARSTQTTKAGATKAGERDATEATSDDE